MHIIFWSTYYDQVVAPFCKRLADTASSGLRTPLENLLALSSHQFLNGVPLPVTCLESGNSLCYVSDISPGADRMRETKSTGLILINMYLLINLNSI